MTGTDAPAAPLPAASRAEGAALAVALAEPERLPDGGEVRVLSGVAARQAAARLGLTERQIHVLALEQGVIPARYLRNFHTFTPADQIRLLTCRVAVVGLGGLGGHVLEILARLGCGTIRAADHDQFVESNLNRQLLSGESVLDRPKAEAAVARLRDVNPSVTCDAWPRFLDAESLPGFLAGADALLDCLGGLGSRLILHQAAARAGVPMITGGVAGWTGFVSTVLPGDVGPAQSLCAEGGGPAAEDVLGCLVPTLAAAAGLMGAEACRLILGQPPRLRAPGGRMLCFDLSDMSFDAFSLG